MGGAGHRANAGCVPIVVTITWGNIGANSSSSGSITVKKHNKIMVKLICLGYTSSFLALPTELRAFLFVQVGCSRLLLWPFEWIGQMVGICQGQIVDGCCHEGKEDAQRKMKEEQAADEEGQN
jgi:hypothetical protein